MTDRACGVDDWMTHPGQQGLTDEGTPNGSWETMMCRVAKFHHKHDFANPVNNGHDMGYRLTLMLEELGELASAITKGKPKEEAAEELADVFILTLGNALAMQGPRGRVPQEDGSHHDPRSEARQSRHTRHRVHRDRLTEVLLKA